MDFAVSYSRLDSFLFLLEEVFAHQHYRFRTDKEDPVIVDGGSNIGVSVLYFKSLFPQARIHAFEPNPDAFALLARNIEENELQDIDLHNVALLDREGCVDIFLDSEKDASLTASVYEERGGAASVSVECSGLSRWVTGPVDLLKLDVEGAELRVLQELEATGRLREVHSMIIECHHNSGQEALLTGVLELLQRNGFACHLDASFPQRPSDDVPQDILIRAFRRIKEVRPED